MSQSKDSHPSARKLPADQRESASRLALLWGASLAVGILLSVLSLAQGGGFVFIVALGSAILSGMGLGFQSWLNHKQSQTSSQKFLRTLRTDLVRANAVYHFASTLSTTLDYTATLNRALQVSKLALNPQHRNASVVSAVLLFRNTDNHLHVALAQYLNRQDYQARLPARNGILSEALHSNSPIFGKDGGKDPELSLLTGFHNTQSLLALPLRQGYESYGVLIFGVNAEDAFDIRASEPMHAIAVQISVALKNTVLYQSILDDKERIVSIDEQARKKLSRDLHDGPTQTIALISSISSVIQTYLKRDKQVEAIKELDKVQQLAQKTTKEIRHLLFSLRPLVLENKGLIAALDELAKKMQDTYGQAVTVEAEERILDYLDEDDQGTIFYIIEEAINNAAKHAEAQMIWARLFIDYNKNIVIEIEDNGRGFDVDSVTTDYHKRGSLGMVNLRERSEMLRGDFNLQSHIGQGTKITVVMSIAEEQGGGRHWQKPEIDPQETIMANNTSADKVSPQKSPDETGWSDILNDIKP